MRRQGNFAIACLVLSALVSVGLAARAIAWQSGAAAEAAAKANPELISALSKEIGGSPEQAAGAAGALFSVAKSRLKPDEFAQVEKAVPGMDLMLQAAPPAGGGATGAISQMSGSASSLAAASAAFSKLGLKADAVTKAVPVVTSFVTKSGGAGVGNLLAGALK
jgi:uncharacterized protein VcgC/VcgE DUF2780